MYDSTLREVENRMKRQDGQKRKRRRKRRKNSELKIYLQGVWVGILLTLIVIFLLQRFGVISTWFRTDFSKNIEERASVIKGYVDKFYWKDNASDEELADAAAKGMVAVLGDRYSAYYNPEEYKDMMSSVKGGYEGIGVSIRLNPDNYVKTLEEIQKGTPAEQAGLKVGDILCKVNGEDVSALNLDETIKLIKGETGTKVQLQIQREENGEKVTKDIMVTIENIISQTVETRMLEHNIGYIRVKEFDEVTKEQFKSAMDTMKKENKSGLIIDVRNNGGGSLSTCIDLMDRILPAGKLITETNKNKENKEYLSTDDESYDKPVVVLINGQSASASEVFAGCLQDREKATLVGETSFGKGIVQSIFSLEKSIGGGLKLTTGEYLLPSGRSIHEKGLTPDVEEPYTGKTQEIGAEDDNQLAKAIEILKKGNEQ